MKALFAAILILFVSACNSAGVKSDDPQPVAVVDSVNLDELGDYLMGNSQLALVMRDGVMHISFCFAISGDDESCLWWPVDKFFPYTGESI